LRTKKKENIKETKETKNNKDIKRKWSASPLGKSISTEELQSGMFYDYHDKMSKRNAPRKQDEERCSAKDGLKNSIKDKNKRREEFARVLKGAVSRNTFASEKSNGCELTH
jgi:hypothetical protein